MRRAVILSSKTQIRRFAINGLQMAVSTENSTKQNVIHEISYL